MAIFAHQIEYLLQKSLLQRINMTSHDLRHFVSPPTRNQIGGVSDKIMPQGVDLNEKYDKRSTNSRGMTRPRKNNNYVQQHYHNPFTPAWGER